ncbi:MAG: ABC transporter substrate-binding protein [Deltaproteobacteria bacterium]|nr:ABC transporter substrate-binding protein [Deltaproteobacteria bacterium]MBW1737618.1 ABC transporter substrate-binding protein [Deltaproteobacteria bacterium]MBW1908732.1 ABC transporter substrate-binding protein [Deltaproteobacteria bacterium]MBW2033688.1 ABC transporter substrate-binding protein [Deltaproteobacteria bacterium]MBW2114661.1 ABC transporter substrate-binding protein [Deltaproteobacteria bacterium]
MAPKFFWAGTFFFVSIIAVSTLSQAGEPTESIRKTADRIIAIVSDPELQTSGKDVDEKKSHKDKLKKRNRLVREAVDERFDWEEMSRRTLARYWRDRTDDEKKEFIDLFGKLLERTYLDQVEGYSGEKVLYVGETVDGDYSVVRVKIITKKETEIPVKYRLKKKGNDWFVYDVIIEGVSLVNNYRTQFNTIIVRYKYKGLIKRLRAKVKTD